MALEPAQTALLLGAVVSAWPGLGSLAPSRTGAQSYELSVRVLLLHVIVLGGDQVIYSDGWSPHN